MGHSLEIHRGEVNCKIYNIVMFADNRTYFVCFKKSLQ